MSSACKQETQKTKKTGKLNATKRKTAKTSCNTDAQSSKKLQPLRGDSICNEIALISPPTHGLELYTIFGMKDQGFTCQMMHENLILSFDMYRGSTRRI